MEKINTKLINKILTLIFLSILGLFLYYTKLIDLFFNLLSALIPFFIGFFICWLLMPVSEFLNKKLKINKKIANIISIFLSIFILLGIVFVIIPLVILQIIHLADGFPQIWENFLNNLSYFRAFNIDLSYIYDKIYTIDFSNIFSYIQSSFTFIGEAINYLYKGAMGLLGFIIQIILGYIISFYFMGSMKGFVKGLLSLTNQDNPERRKLFLDISKVLFSYVRGVIIISSFVAIIMTIGCMVIGIESPLLFGIISGLTNVIPYLGPVLGGVPLFIVALSMGVKQAFLSVILIIIVQMVESNLLQPKVMSKSTNLHPVTIIVGLLVLGKLFGIIGVLVATPILSMLNVWLKQSKYKDKIKI